MLRRFIGACAAALAIGLAGHAVAEVQKEINFGIISTESTQNLKASWQPMLNDMQKQTGVKINAFFAPDYAGIIEAMRFNKVQVAWYGNKSAIEAVDRANGEVFVQTLAKGGAPGYWSLLVVHKDSPLKSIEDVIKHAKNLTLGNGDPNSTSVSLFPAIMLSPRMVSTPRLRSSFHAAPITRLTCLLSPTSRSISPPTIPKTSSA